MSPSSLLASLPAPSPAPNAPQSRTLPRFPADPGFLAELRRRVDAHFTATGRSPRDCPTLYLKAVFILAWLAASYVALVFFAGNWWQGILASLSLALAMAAVAFSIQHDGNHQAFSRHGWINRLAGACLDLLGASSYLWHWEHNVSHHTYCNITGHDADIERGSLIRMSPHQPWRPWHAVQHVTLWILYAFMAVRWHLYGDFRDVLAGRIGCHPIPRPRGWALALFLAGKAFSFTLAFAVPLLFHAWWVVLLYYLLTLAVMGLVASIVLQLAHCMDETDFPQPNPESLRMDHAWAIHQVETTVDFARGNRLLSWYIGGLNFQIEHHLFPRVSHVHYPELARIVEATCREYGVRYTAHRTLRSALRSHYRWLKRMSRRPEE